MENASLIAIYIGATVGIIIFIYMPYLMMRARHKAMVEHMVENSQKILKELDKIKKEKKRRIIRWKKIKNSSSNSEDI